MNKKINRKGISLVALVITIIVLVVLTGAVVITGVNVPQQGQLAVFKNNVSNMQDAVTMKMLNNMVNYRQENNENVKWIGVVSSYDVEDIGTAPEFDTKINDVDVAALDGSLKDEVSLKNEDFEKYYISERGEIYHKGYEYNGQVYYNKTTSTPVVESIEILSGITKTKYITGDKLDLEGLEVKVKYNDGTEKNVRGEVCEFNPTIKEATAIEGTKQIQVSYGGKTAEGKIEIEVEIPESWNVGSLSTSRRAVGEQIGGVSYYAPIPLGFTVSTNKKEDEISEGLVIQDNNRNQFVWVPVNDSYTMIGDITGDAKYHTMQSSSPYSTDIPYLDNNRTTAFAYWQASVNGHSGTITGTGTYSEPYISAGSWETLEYQAMVTSVLKYGGFYVGRYETGGSTSAPVVKSEVTPIRNIKWNSVATMTAEPTSGTATYVARNMYPSTNTTYGVVSTLIYGIQWDSIMCWAKCYNNYSSATSSVQRTGVSKSDCYNNIYDLAGNVCEWSMEIEDSTLRVGRGGYYNIDGAVSIRFNGSNPTNKGSSIGFRTALYVK